MRLLGQFQASLFFLRKYFERKKESKPKTNGFYPLICFCVRKNLLLFFFFVRFFCFFVTWFGFALRFCAFSKFCFCTRGQRGHAFIRIYDTSKNTSRSYQFSFCFHKLEMQKTINIRFEIC